MSWACDQTLISNVLASYEVTGPLFVQTLQAFFAAQCALVGDHLWPADATDLVLQDPNYDFIVLGAGAGGAVVANRLSENPSWKVLLVEAGGNPTLSTEVPQLFYSSVGTAVDWNFQTQPQDGACRSYKGKGCVWPQGKVLGGSSSINGMFYVRGNKGDYDSWSDAGNEGWSYDEVLPYFKKMENFTGTITTENEKYHSTSGPLHVVENTPSTIESLILQAGIELGINHISEINAGDPIGTTMTQNNMKDNYRFATARGYLSPIKERTNLHVMKNALAMQILFTSGTNTVSGVLINKDGRNITVNAKKEVISSCGSIKTPQLLMLSGIGPKEHLQEMGIDVIADLPVGKNFKDHPYAPIYYTLSGDENSTSLSVIVEAIGNYMLNATGPLINTSPHRVLTFLNTSDSTSTIPDIQFHHLVLAPGTTNLIDIFDKLRLSDEFHDKFLAMNKAKYVIQVCSVLLHPKSSGNITLASKSPFDDPLIYANYYDDPEDMATILRAIKQHSLKLGETTAFKSAGFALEWVELDACAQYEKASDEHLECIARELTLSLYHPIGTSKMAPESDPTSVVDAELKVRQVSGVRVMDASVIPNEVSGNTMVATMMVGEKGADMIKQAWSSK